MNKKGFTLVELIASIVIIGIIIVIMVPVVLNTSNKVKETNYKNLKDAIIQSTIDYILTSGDEGYSLDDIKPKNTDCLKASCGKVYNLGDILDNGIYVSNTKNNNNELTVVNPITGNGMRNKKIIICYNLNNYSLKGYFAEDYKEGNC